MFLSLKEMERGKVAFRETYPPGAIEFLDERLRQAGALEVEGVAELSPALGEITVRGRLQGRMETECDRCLEAVVLPIDASFTLSYLPASALAAREEVEIEKGALEAGFYEGGGLDLADVLREQILLALPMQRVCQEDCQGICPVCGQHRNRAACDCHERLPDDRWARLRDL
ncbi:MAG: DUF177 domain-containing protein [Acidobacteria bacterium]|nr:DUF177 domain-containing protein [Acidobacteriota bacterium]